MNHWYELWDSEHGNLVGEFATQQDALATILLAYSSQTDDSISSLVLVRETSADLESEPDIVGQGRALLELAQKDDPTRFGVGTPLRLVTVTFSQNTYDGHSAQMVRHARLHVPKPASDPDPVIS